MEENQRNVIVSPSFIYNSDLNSDSLSEGFEGFDAFVACCGNDNPNNDPNDNQIDELLFQGSQMYEASKEDSENIKMIDILLLQVSQQFENQVYSCQVQG